MKQGDTVLVWGATGGIGGYAIQYVLNGGGTPIGVVSSPERAQLLNEMGCEAVIDRRAEGYQFWSDEHTQDESEWRRFGKKIRELVGEDPDIVFEHPGRSTMGASIFAVKRGGTVVTCAATSGYMVEFDNRHFWMKLKRLSRRTSPTTTRRGTTNKLIDQGKIQPIMRDVYTLDQVGEAALSVHHNQAEGKLGVLCLAPEEGLGIDDPEKRDRIGEDKITLFRTKPWRHPHRSAQHLIGEPDDDGRWHDPHRDRPHRHRRPRPRGGDRLLPASVRRRGAPPRDRRERRRRGGARQGRRQLHPAHRGHPRPTRRSPSRSRSGARVCTTSATASTTAPRRSRR